MFGVRPVSDELNVPVPEPLLVFVVKDMVGFVFVDHTTPLVVIAAPPSELTFPPEIAVVEVIKSSHILLIVEKLTDDRIILEPRRIFCYVESPIISEVFRDTILIVYLRS